MKNKILFGSMGAILLALLMFVTTPAYAMQADEGYVATQPRTGPLTQQGLLVGGRPTEAGCAPTSVAYVLEYWHSYNSAYRLASAQNLLDSNVKQGKFFSNGMSLTDLHDELDNLGYDVVDFRGSYGKTFPFVAAINPLPSYQHAVVVMAISGGIVTFYDPWDGRMRTFSVEQFEEVYPCKCGMVIKPKNFVPFRSGANRFMQE